ncbi:hypothetical protein DIE14_14385 [Burkholderia sp. Bp9017]|uniref:PAAR domain-containing protein n=1 Tax=Burkholderia anthina TaxID=179879 RepID=A0A7T6VEC1_9BURK|nr:MULTISPECIES: hypothetical protein [Burkholderia]MBY4867665.1 hypothetical protein [Burkholderia anthina]QQK02348.1 hypothetical protein JFN94_14890 [Burkholderia anthina]RQZ26393.1 hypothetical protein DIE14_14385 [Burkholderia sp. Bp9017]RQZ34225.1 hypothetical protein DIE13_14295 [Burkholderia sp. Bp9016]
MIRYFLARGDRGGSATITEGLESVTCSNPPPRVQIATLYMKTYCSACKQEGFVSPKGPRLPGRAPNGQPWALSGDVNACGCNPPPVFHAERGMRMFVGHTSAVESKEPGNGISHRPIADAEYDEQYVLKNAKTGRPLARVSYRIHTSSGELFSGTTDSMGHTQRVATRCAEKLRIEIVEKNDAA